MKTDKSRWKQWRVTLILVFLGLTINLISSQSGWVEEYYSVGIYPLIGAGMRRYIWLAAFQPGRYSLFPGIYMADFSLIQDDQKPFSSKTQYREDCLWTYLYDQ